MAKKDRIRRVVDNNDSFSKKNKGQFIRSEYAQTYMLLFLGIVGTLFIESGEALNILCRYLNKYTILEIASNLSIYTWIKYMFKFTGLLLGLLWTYVMFKCSDKLKGEQR